MYTICTASDGPAGGPWRGSLAMAGATWQNSPAPVPIARGAERMFDFGAGLVAQIFPKFKKEVQLTHAYPDDNLIYLWIPLSHSLRQMEQPSTVLCPLTGRNSCHRTWTVHTTDQMTTIDQHKSIVRGLNQRLTSMGVPDFQMLYYYYSEAGHILEDCPDERPFAFSLTTMVKEWCDRLWSEPDDDFMKLKWDCILMEARNKLLDSYLIYLEKNRDQSEKFYEPRRSCFLRIGLIQALQDLIDDKLDVLSVSLPPGTGKTTQLKFFHSAIIGWFPKDYNLFFSHSSDITRMYYDGVLSILTDHSEYTWSEIFPDLEVTSTNAKMGTINVGPYKPFQNLMTASVGSEMAGKVRCSKMLFVDDMVGKIEEALNPNILNKLWNIYSTDARQRKVTGCKELHLATRWSVHDPIGRLQRSYAGNDRCRFIAVPDIDPETGESNFMFDVNPFTVEFYHDQQKLMDEVTYRCLYKNDPIEREGLLFPEDSLRRYTNLPSAPPDEILIQADCKGKGTDFMAVPCLYRYGDDYYAEDCVCNREADYEIQYNAVADLIVRNEVTSGDFEANMGGDRVMEEVNKRVEERGWVCNLTATPTESNKEARIFQTANWVKQHVLFKDKSKYAAKSDYATMMEQLMTYSVTGKNPNDDVPDVFANLAIRVTGARKIAKVEAVFNPFRSYMT